MVTYSDDYSYAYVDGYKFRRDTKTGYFLSTKRIGERRKRLHVYVWEKANGYDVPIGFNVHHIDKDKNNNEPYNLGLLYGTTHQRYHAKNLSEEHKAKLRKHLLEKAIPLSKEWHSSQSGHEWHVQHGKDVFGNLTAIKYICTNCGKEFESKKHYSKTQNCFCSNNCKSAYRRKMGYDNVVKICERCGGEFLGNKYQRIKYCEGCRRELGLPRGCIQYDG